MGLTLASYAYIGIILNEQNVGINHLLIHTDYVDGLFHVIVMSLKDIVERIFNAQIDGFFCNILHLLKVSI